MCLNDLCGWLSHSGALKYKCTTGFKQLSVLKCQLGDYVSLDICRATMGLEGADWAAECPRVLVGQLDERGVLGQLCDEKYK